MLHGHRLVARIAGDSGDTGRPVLLMVHGLGGSSETWHDVLPGLAQRYTVVAPDLLGHGESDKPRHDYSLGAHANVLRDLMIAIGVERATVIGQSLGGGIAMQLAYQHPKRCERLVLVSSGGLGSEVSWLLRRAQPPGRRVPDAGALPVVRARRRQRAEPATARPRAAGAATRRGVADLCVAHRAGEPSVVRAHAARGRRCGWSGGQRPGPPVPGVARPDAHPVGPPRPDDPGGPRRPPRTRSFPAAGS